MSTIHGIFKDSATDMLKMKDVLKFLIEVGMDNLFPNMCILYRIFLTIPVTSANAERNFSRLTLIKNYLRSTIIVHERQTGLSLISIEREVACNCDYDKVIEFCCNEDQTEKIIEVRNHSVYIYISLSDKCLFILNSLE